MTPKRIGILTFDDVTASHVTVTADAFNAAALDNECGGRVRCYHVSTISPSSEPISTESGMTLVGQETFVQAGGFDTVVIPGGCGLRRSDLNLQVHEWILKHADETQRFACVCSGIYGLAPTGLLDGREVTTHWRFATDVSRRFPRLKVDHKRRLVKDGRFFTSSGLTAGIELSLALIEEDYGVHVAMAVGRDLVTHLMPKEDGLAFSEPTEVDSYPTKRFADLVAWIMQNLDHNLSIEVLARRACMCPRHFSRTFKSIVGVPPAEFVQNLRLNEARRRLSTRGKAIRSIATSVGFVNPDMFNRAFERRFGTRPRNFLEAAPTSRPAKSKALPGAELSARR